MSANDFQDKWTAQERQRQMEQLHGGRPMSAKYDPWRSQIVEAARTGRPERSPLDDAHDTLSRASALSRRLCAAIDAFLGSPDSKEASGGETDNLRQHGVLPGLAASARDTCRRVYAAERALDRLEALLPKGDEAPDDQ